MTTIIALVFYFHGYCLVIIDACKIAAVGFYLRAMLSRSRTTQTLTLGTHCRNTSDKLHHLTLSSTLWKRSYSGSRRVQRIRDILFNIKLAI